MSSRIKGIIDAVSDLAMDYQSRMARAKDQGFDTDTPVYHSTASDFDAFDPDRAIGSQFWSTTDRAAIESGDVGAQGKGVVKEMYQRINNPAGWNEYDKFGIDELIGQGYDGLKLPDTDGQSTMVAFNPNQYRSVNAAFDPAKKDSSNLLASVTGAGLLGGSMLASEDADASLRSLAQRGMSLVDIIDPKDSRVGEYYLQKGSDPKSIGSVKTDYALDSGFGDGYMASQNTEIAPGYRRQGLAREMYDAIEEVSGNKLVPSDTLSPDGAAMWNARNRGLLEQVQQRMGSDNYDTVEQVLRPDGMTPSLQLKGFSRNFGTTGLGAGLLGGLQSEDAEAGPISEALNFGQRAAAGGLLTSGGANANTVSQPQSGELLDSIGDTALEAMSGVNRAMADGVNFLTSDQINAMLNLSGSDKRIPDLYDIPGVESGTKGNYMEPGLLRQIVRQGSEFLSPI